MRILNPRMNAHKAHTRVVCALLGHMSHVRPSVGVLGQIVQIESKHRVYRVFWCMLMFRCVYVLSHN